jgi:predicted site-specific integrase-resolvase
MQNQSLRQYRPHQVANNLGISISTFWRLVKNGDIKTNKLTTRTTTVSEAELARFINSRTGV